MTNSQKEFEEILIKHRLRFLTRAEVAKLFWQCAWDARGKFDEEVCNLSCEEAIRNGNDDREHEAKELAEKIRKRGGE